MTTTGGKEKTVLVWTGEIVEQVNCLLCPTWTKKGLILALHTGPSTLPGRSLNTQPVSPEQDLYDTKTKKVVIYCRDPDYSTC